jgi:hypothetical protein
MKTILILLISILTFDLAFGQFCGNNVSFDSIKYEYAVSGTGGIGGDNLIHFSNGETADLGKIKGVGITWHNKVDQKEQYFLFSILRFMNCKGYEILTASTGEITYFRNKHSQLYDTLKYDYINIKSGPLLEGQEFCWGSESPDSTRFFKNPFGSSFQGQFDLYKFLNNKGYSIAFAYENLLPGHYSSYHQVFKRRRK